MSSANVTVTAYSGPGESNTSAVFTDVESYTFDVGRQILSLNMSGGVVKTFDLTTVTTVTVTVAAAGGNHTVVVS